MNALPDEPTYNPWSQSAADVVQSLGSDAASGLTADEAMRRLERYGRNEIPEPTPDPLWLRYWGQLTGDAVVRLLLIGGIASLLLGDYLEGASIILMLNIMAAFGLWQEGKANDAARSLRTPAPRAGKTRLRLSRSGQARGPILTRGWGLRRVLPPGEQPAPHGVLREGPHQHDRS